MFDEADRVLLLHTLDLTPRPGHPAGLDWWELPGGKLKPDEAPEQGALRELYEETGIRLQALDEYWGAFDTSFTFRGQLTHQREHVFAVQHHGTSRVSRAALDPKEHEAHLGHRWWAMSDLLAAGLRLHPPELRKLMRMREGRVRS